MVAMRRLELRREQVLHRLWEIARLRPEMTGGVITGQFKALSVGSLPGRREMLTVPGDQVVGARRWCIRQTCSAPLGCVD